MRNQHPFEPFEAKDIHVYEFDYDTAVTALSLLEHVEEDNLLYWVISDVSLSVDHRRKQGSFSGEQVSDLVNRIEKRLLTKFPVREFISHDGYRILIEAWLARLKKARTLPPKLIDDARAIPNIADAAFVLCNLARVMTSREQAKRVEILKEAKEIIGRIPSTIDLADRMEAFASIALTIDQGLCREAVKDAFSLTLLGFKPVQGRDERQEQRDRLIDLAYKIDKDFANSLVALLSDDPAKKGLEKRSKNKLTELQLVKSLLNEDKEFICKTAEELDLLPAAAQTAVSQLNADSAVPVHFQRILEIVVPASRLSIDTAFPVYLFVVEDLIKMYSQTAQASTYIRSMFDAITGVSHSFCDALRVVSQMPVARVPAQSGGGEQSLLVREGDREIAIRFIQDWLATMEANDIVICDPYFGSDELFVLHLALQTKNERTYRILTSELHLISARIAQPWQQSFQSFWKSALSSTQDPPPTQVIVAGTEPDGKPPFHDRWILCEKGGLNLGTSINSLGRTLSNIQVISSEEAQVKLGELDPFTSQRQRFHQGKRVRYSSFTL
jgi:hypothetical protein